MAHRPPKQSAFLASRLIVALAAVTLASVAKEPQAGARLTLEKTSPHVPWAIPLAGGPVDALVIAPRNTLRDVVELAQRIELGYVAVPIWASDSLQGPSGDSQGIPEEDASAALAEALQGRHDVIIAGNFRWDILPEEARKVLLEHVASGTGLVLARFGGETCPALEELCASLAPPELTPALGLSVNGMPLPLGLPDPRQVKTSLYGQGRVVMLDYAGPPPKTHFVVPVSPMGYGLNDKYSEDFYSLAAHAICWAGGRESNTRIDDVQPLDSPLPDEDAAPPPGTPWLGSRYLEDAFVGPLSKSYAMRFNQAADSKYDVRVQVRNPLSGWAIKYTYEDAPVRKGRTSYPIQVSCGPGDYLVDVWLLKKKGVSDWYTEPVSIQGWPEIEGFAVSKTALLPNDAFEVTFDIRPNEFRPQPCMAGARAVDPHGRVVAEARLTIPSTGGHVALPLSPVGLLAPSLKIEAYALAPLDNMVSEVALQYGARASCWLPVRMPHNDDAFSLLVGGPAPEEPNARGFLKTLAGLGVDKVLVEDDPVSAAAVARLGLCPFPHINEAAPRELSERLRRALRDPWLAAQAHYVLDGLLGNLSATAAFRDAGDVLRAEDAAARLGLLLPAEAGAPGVGVYPATTSCDFALVPLEPAALARLRTSRQMPRGCRIWLRPSFSPDGSAYARWAVWYTTLNQFAGLWLGDAYGTALSGGSAPLLPDGCPTSWLEAVGETSLKLRAGVAALLMRSERVAALSVPPPDAAQADVTRNVPAEWPHVAGDGEFDGEHYNYIFGRAHIAAFLRKPDAAEKSGALKLSLGREGFTYDILAEDENTLSNSVRRRLEPGEAGLYAALPYEVSGIDLDVPETLHQGQWLLIRLNVRTRGDLPGDHIIHIELAPHGGEPLPYYARNITCPGGAGKASIPLALNERTAPMAITATDVLSGVTASSAVQVLPRYASQSDENRKDQPLL